MRIGEFVGILYGGEYVSFVIRPVGLNPSQPFPKNMVIGNLCKVSEFQFPHFFSVSSFLRGKKNACIIQLLQKRNEGTYVVYCYHYSVFHVEQARFCVCFPFCQLHRMVELELEMVPRWF